MGALLTTDEVAVLCRATPSAVRYWRRTDKGPLAIKLTKGYVYDTDDVLAWLSMQREAAIAARGVRPAMPETLAAGEFAEIMRSRGMES